jgi:TetR/AcrR family transcriptional regulator
MDSKEKILDVAMEEFGLYGIDGARIDHIAHKAKINKAMIYYHFHSKEKLYQAVIENHTQRIGDFLEKTLAEEPDFEAFLLKLAIFFKTIAMEKRGFAPIILREMAGGHKTIKEALARTMTRKELVKKLLKMIQKGVKDGRYRDIDIKQAAISFWSMNIGYILFAPVINAVWELDDIDDFVNRRPQQIVDLFLNGIKVR